MRNCANLARFGLLMVLLLIAGCTGSGIDITNTQRSQDAIKSVPEPLAIVSIAPVTDWINDLQQLYPASRELAGINFDHSTNLLTGIDEQQHAILLLFASKHGISWPVLYLPVTDYEQLLNWLATRFRMHRAFASSFTIGSQKILVKPVGKYAVFGTSLNQINGVPCSPVSYRDQLSSNAAVALKLNPQSLGGPEREQLVEFLGRYIDNSFAQTAIEMESVVLELKVDSQSGIQVQTDVEPVPSNLDKINHSIEDSIAEFRLPISSRTTPGGLVFDLSVNSEQFSFAWSKIESMVKASFYAQPRSIMQKASTQNRAPLPKVFYGNGGFNSSSSESTGSGGRRGGGG